MTNLQSKNKPEKTNFGEHYNVQDKAQALHIETWLAANPTISRAALARMCRVSDSLPTQVLSGTYPSSPSKHLAAMLSAITHVASVPARGAVLKTSVYQLGVSCCELARGDKHIAVFTGVPGVGKTAAVREYARTNPNTLFIEVDPTMTRKDLLGELAAGVGYFGKGTVNKLFNEVVRVVRDTDSLIIVDEAEYLPDACLDILRRIRDKANIGVVLVGKPQLLATIKPEHGHFDQLRSRVGFCPTPVRKISKADGAMLVSAALGDVDKDISDEIYRICNGSARMLSEGLVNGIKRQLGKGQELSTALVKAVAEQMLSLQTGAL